MGKDEALKQALEYVDLVPDDRYNAEHIDREALVAAIEEALAQPEQEPVELLLQLRSALALASAICDAVPNRESSHLGTLVNAQPDGSHGYRQIQEAEAALVKYLETPTVTPPQPEQEPEFAYVMEAGDDRWKKLPIQERNFCQRCGKRTADLTTIHTCTPPENT